MRSWKIAALLALLAAAVGCAGNPPASEPSQQVQPTSSSVTISSVEQATSEGETHITLKGNSPFSYTSYEPDYSTMVLELLDVDATPIAGMTAVNSPELESLETSVRNDGSEGGRVSQVTFHFKRPTLHQMRTEGSDLRIEFQPDPSRKPFPENNLAEASGAAAPALLPEATLPSAPVLSEAEKLALEKAQPASALLAVQGARRGAKNPAQDQRQGGLQGLRAEQPLAAGHRYGEHPEPGSSNPALSDPQVGVPGEDPGGAVRHGPAEGGPGGLRSQIHAAL